MTRRLWPLDLWCRLGVGGGEGALCRSCVAAGNGPEQQHAYYYAELAPADARYPPRCCMLPCASHCARKLPPAAPGRPSIPSLHLADNCYKNIEHRSRSGPPISAESSLPDFRVSDLAPARDRRDAHTTRRPPAAGPQRAESLLHGLTDDTDTERATNGRRHDEGRDAD